jgi:hypothetical protein
MNPRNLPTELKTTEKTLKKLDVTEPEPRLPESEDYYQRLHDRIMAKVEDKEIKPPPPKFVKAKNILKAKWRNGLYLVTTMALAAVVGVQSIRNIDYELTDNQTVAKFKNEDQILDLLKESPNVLDNTVLSFHNAENIMNDDIYSNSNLTKELIDSL